MDDLYNIDDVKVEYNDTTDLYTLSYTDKRRQTKATNFTNIIDLIRHVNQLKERMLMNPAAVAAGLGISKSYVYMLHRRGTIEMHKIDTLTGQGELWMTLEEFKRVKKLFEI